MTGPHDVSQSALAARRARLRARAIWAFVLAAIGLAAALAGLVQYAQSGAISIRPGREPLVGGAAGEWLIAVSAVSVGFLAFGMILRWRARRSGDRF